MNGTENGQDQGGPENVTCHVSVFCPGKPKQTTSGKNHRNGAGRKNGKKKPKKARKKGRGDLSWRFHSQELVKNLFFGR